MPGHGAGFSSDDAPQSVDAKLMWRLMSYLKPYWPLMLLSMILLGLNTIGELIPPLITRKAVDAYIMPEWGLVRSEGISFLKPGLERFSTGDGAAVVRVSEMDRATRTLLEARKLLSKQRLVEVPPNLADSISQQHLIPVSSGRFFISADTLYARYHRSLISKVRAKSVSGIGVLGLILFVVLSLNLLLNFGQVYTLQLVGQKSMADLRQDMFVKYLRSPLDFFSENPAGRLVTRATNDVEAVNQFFSAVLVYIVKDVLLLGGIIIILVRMNLMLTGVVLLIVPFLAFATFIFRIYARQAYREVRKYLAQVNAKLQESVSGIAVIHAFVQEQRMMREFSRVNNRLFKAFMKQIYVFGTFRPLMDFLSGLAIALLLWFGGNEIIRGALSFGALLAFMSYVEMFFQPIRDLSEKYNIMQSAFAAAERMFKILDGPEEPPGGNVHLDRVQGRVQFQNVWFAYQDQEWVLKDVSFVVEPGQTLALVGPPGAGKSSVIKLLLRFYDPQKGRILIDGVDIRDIPIQELRSHMAMVQQDVFLFSGTVRDNIALRSDIELDRIVQAARMVDADRFIDRLEGTYDAEVTERGATFSQGQRQLLAFARALAHDPDILILDEATASVDQETEEIIQRSLTRLLRGRTAIVVAHRLSTIRDADNIIVIQKGKIVEQGKHNELLKAKGFYYYLYGLQFAGRVPEN